MFGFLPSALQTSPFCPPNFSLRKCSPIGFLGHNCCLVIAVRCIGHRSVLHSPTQRAASAYAACLPFLFWRISMFRTFGCPFARIRLLIIYNMRARGG